MMSYLFYSILCFFFFKQKTAYEMRISDWSSDVCSSDLNFQYLKARLQHRLGHRQRLIGLKASEDADQRKLIQIRMQMHVLVSLKNQGTLAGEDRKSVV